MVSTFYPPYNFGGDGMHVHSLSNELAKLGHSVDVFHCEDSFLFLNGERPTVDVPNHPGVKVFGLKSGKGFLSPLLTQQTGFPVFKSQLKRALESNNYDVIHYHNISLMGINVLTYGSAVKLYTLHEHWLVCPMHVLWKFDREVCTSKSCFRCQLAAKRPPQLWRQTGMLERCLKSIDCFIAPSRFTLDKHLEAGLQIPVRHLPHFLTVTGNDVEPTYDEVENARPYFLFVGRLERIKGLQNLIPLFQELPDCDLLIAGDGNYAGKLRELAGDRPNIKFLGRLDQTELASLYRSAIAAIVPSICYETFGMVSIEAFSYGTPVIVNKLGALPEVVEESGGGLVYERTDQLLGAIKRLAGNPKLRDEMGNLGYAAFQEKWSAEAYMRQYLELVREIGERDLSGSSRESAPRVDAEA